MAHPESSGGSGGGPAPGEGGIRTTRLYARAVLEGWPVSASVRVGVVRYLAGVVAGDVPEDLEDEGALAQMLAKPGPRERIAAARALISADRVNLAAVKLQLDVDAGGQSIDADAVKAAQAVREARRARQAAAEASE